jgi:hypothetical protein
MTAQALAGLLIAAGLIVVAVLVYRDLRDRRLADAVERAAARRHELELAALERGGELEGELVIVNTPRPDDQTLKGVCRRELASGGLVLEAAVYLERRPSRGSEEVDEVPAGDVVVPAYSFAQIVHRTQEG